MSEYFDATVEVSPSTHQWFKQESLYLMQQQRELGSYPGYPSKRLSYATPRGVETLVGRLHLPIGEWDTGIFPNTPGDEQSEQLYDQGMTLDTYGRPLHPWINDMLDPAIGVVTGRGFYRNWGPNYTADPVIVRTDTPRPMVLLIKRSDTSSWALPGGFVDLNEHSYDTALREAYEETLIDWSHFAPHITKTYSGPLADPRVTAHAWPETTAYMIHLNPELSKSLSIDSFRGNPDEVESAAWFAMDDLSMPLFGSHELLVRLAAKQL